MDVPAKYTEGQRVEVWFNGWVKATVILVLRWSHWPGNTYPTYVVETATGRVGCGENSMRAGKDP